MVLSLSCSIQSVICTSGGDCTTPSCGDSNANTAAGEACDIIFTAPWINSYANNVANGVLAPLDELLPSRRRHHLGLCSRGLEHGLG